MAFDAEDDQENTGQSQNQVAQAAPGTGSTTLSGGGGGFAGSGGQAAGGGASAPGSYSQAPTSSGGWTNLNSYLSANADQSSGLGQSLANNVGQSAQTAQGALSQNVSDYNNQFSSLPTQAQADTNIQNTLTNTAQDTTGSAPVTQYQGYLNDTQSYSNPQSNGVATTSATPATLQTINGANGQNDYATTQQDYTTAANQLADTQSESGRDILLQNQFGQNGQAYNQGEQSFDQLLLQQNAGNAQALQNVYQQYNPTVGVDNNANDAAFGTSADLYNANNAASATAANAAATNTAIQTDAQNALQSQIGTDTTNVNNELTAAQTAQDQQYQALQSGLYGNDLSAQQAQQLGLTQGMNLQGVTDQQLASYLGPEGAPLTVNQAANQQDYTNQSALQALAAGQPYAQGANLGLSGTGPQAIQGPTYNTGALQSQIGTNQGLLGTADATTQTAIDKFIAQAAAETAGQNAAMTWQMGSGLAGTAAQNPIVDQLAGESLSQQVAALLGQDAPSLNQSQPANATAVSQLDAALAAYTAAQNNYSGGALGESRATNAGSGSGVGITSNRARG